MAIDLPSVTGLTIWLPANQRALEVVNAKTYNRYLAFFPAFWRYFKDVLRMLVHWTMKKPT